MLSRAESAQGVTGRQQISTNLFPQQVQRTEALFCPQELDEGDFQFLAVEVTVKVQ